VAEAELSVRRACTLAGLSRSAWYRPTADRIQCDREVIGDLNVLVEKHRRWSFWKCFDRLTGKLTSHQNDVAPSEAKASGPGQVSA